MKALRRVAAQICIQHILQPRQYMWRLVFQDNWSWAILLSLTVWFIVLKFGKLSEKIALVHTRVKDESTELQRKNLRICRDSWAKTQKSDFRRNISGNEVFVLPGSAIQLGNLNGLFPNQVPSKESAHTQTSDHRKCYDAQIEPLPERGQLYCYDRFGL